MNVSIPKIRGDVHGPLEREGVRLEATIGAKLVPRLLVHVGPSVDPLDTPAIDEIGIGPPIDCRRASPPPADV